MSDLVNRIQAALNHAGVSWSKSATLIGLSAQAASKWKKGQISKETLEKLSILLEVNYAWLATGQGEMVVKDYALGNIEPAPTNPNARIRYAPVLNYVQAGAFTEIGDNGYDEYLPYSDDKVSDNAYWLIVKGDSMTPDFQEGDLLLVDANRQPKSGDYVVAKIADENEATFKRYKVCGFDEKLNTEYFQLIALNEFYSPIDSRHKPFVVLGVVVEYKRTFV